MATQVREGPFALRLARTRTGTWRHERPVVDEQRCRRCGICPRYCPSGVLSLGETLQVDYEYCKGCGICVTVCPFEALRMVSETEAAAGAAG